MSDRIGARLVALRLAPGEAFVDALRGCWERGDAVLPLAPDLPAAQLRASLDALRPALLVEAGGTTHLAGADPVPPDVALVIATSGSTGQPKGVELTSAALQASVRASLARLGATAADRWLCCLPTSTIAGLQVLLRAQMAGSPLVVHPGFDVQAVADEPDVGLVSLVPVMLARLLDAGVDVARFRRVLLGGAGAPATLLARARDAGARVVVTYGATETAGGCVYDGVALDGVAVAVDPDGRVRVRGPVLACGYRDGSALDVRDGWLRMPDVGRILPDGRLTVLGRVDDVIVTGGHKVVAAEVAALLGDHPQVAEAAVTGRADPDWGERVVAVVVPRNPGDPPDLRTLRAHVAARVAAWKAPTELHVVAALPRLASGKVALRALGGEGAGTSSDAMVRANRPG